MIVVDHRSLYLRKVITMVHKICRGLEGDSDDNNDNDGTDDNDGW